VCWARQIVLLVLFASLTVACGQTAASLPSDNDTNHKTPTYTRYPTYTPYPTYTLYPTYTPADVESLIWPNGPRDDVIVWTDAADFVGAEMIVEGTVVRTHNSGKVVFLNFAEDHREAFSVAIFPDDWSKFPGPPETLFDGRRIRVQGLIEEYQGAPEIVVRDPWQIEVAFSPGEEASCECGTPVVMQVVVTATPSATDAPVSARQPADPSAGATAPPPATQVVNWQDATAYAGQTVTVEGQIVDTYNSGKVVFLNFDEDFQRTFKVVIFPEAWPLFPQPPEDLYRGQMVRVTGQIKIYQGAPEIIVGTPDTIQIVE